MNKRNNILIDIHFLKKIHIYINVQFVLYIIFFGKLEIEKIEFSIYWIPRTSTSI